MVYLLLMEQEEQWTIEFFERIGLSFCPFKCFRNWFIREIFLYLIMSSSLLHYMYVHCLLLSISWVTWVSQHLFRPFYLTLSWIIHMHRIVSRSKGNLRLLNWRMLRWNLSGLRRICRWSLERSIFRCSVRISANIKSTSYGSPWLSSVAFVPLGLEKCIYNRY